MKIRCNSNDNKNSLTPIILRYTVKKHFFPEEWRSDQFTWDLYRSCLGKNRLHLRVGFPDKINANNKRPADVKILYNGQKYNTV